MKNWINWRVRSGLSLAFNPRLLGMILEPPGLYLSRT